MSFVTELQLVEKLKTMILPDRLMHSYGVAEMAEALARHYGADPEKARIAGLLHDCAKNIPKNEAYDMCMREGVFLKEICNIERGLIHPYLGAYIAKKEFGIEDTEILDAIYYHTTGHENMPLLTKIVYLSDMIEPNRKISGIEYLRKLAFEDLDEALVRSIDSTVRHILNKGCLLDCDTIAARNHLILQKKLKKK